MLRAARRALVPAALLLALAFVGFLVGGSTRESHAELENQVFTSLSDRVRMVVPRGWRATEHPSYPGHLLWMMRSEPPGQIALSSEAFTRQLYCKWQACGDSSPTEKYACFLRDSLSKLRFTVGPAQPGPKETTKAGLPFVWFEYDDGKRFVRHAIAVGEDRAVSLVLASPTADARQQHSRAFDQALRSIRLVTDEEAESITGPDAAVATVEVPPDDGGISDAPVPIDAPAMDGGVTFESAPAPDLAPIGSCEAPAAAPR